MKKQRKKVKQYHKEIKCGMIRFSFYKLKNKFCLRLEISKGWE